MFAVQRGILSARFEQLMLEALDVLLALAEDIRTLMDEEKTGRRWGIAKGAHRQEEMRLLRSPAHSVHTTLDSRTRALLVKREGLDVVLQENRAVREKLAEHGAKFIEFKFVG